VVFITPDIMINQITHKTNIKMRMNRITSNSNSQSKQIKIKKLKSKRNKKLKRIKIKRTLNRINNKLISFLIEKKREIQIKASKRNKFSRQNS
jgi:hypothetical protein